MANELSWANLESDAGLQEILSGMLKPLLYDPTDLTSTMSRAPWGDNLGSETTKTTQYSRDQPFAPASSELSGGASNADIGAASYTHTLTRQLKKWVMTELWRKIGPPNSIDMALLAGMLSEGVGLTITDLLCALFPSLSGTVGSSVEQMSLDILFDGQYALNINRAKPPFSLVVSPHMANKLTDSIKGQGGAIAQSSETIEQIKAKPPGFKFNFGDVSVWDADSVTLDGGATYRRGAMYDAMCFEYQLASASAMGGIVPDSVVKILDGVVRAIVEYAAEDAVSTLIGDFYTSVVETEDDRGIEVRALAA